MGVLRWGTAVLLSALSLPLGLAFQSPELLMRQNSAIYPCRISSTLQIKAGKPRKLTSLIAKHHRTGSALFQNSKSSGVETTADSLVIAVSKQTAIMAFCGALLGPFLDGYHSAFGVLQYENPLSLELAGLRLLQTDYWVPPMFALAAIILGLSYPYLDTLFKADAATRDPSVPKVLTCISFFSLQYYLSGYLSAIGVTAAALHAVLAATAAANWLAFDASAAGAIMSAVTGLAGPALEMAIINGAPSVLGHPLYQYTHPDLLGIPAWIAWVYACGAPAVGNLARLSWRRR